MIRSKVRPLLLSFAASLAALTGLSVHALDSIPVYDVVSIYAMLTGQFQNVGSSSAQSVNENGDAVGYASIDGEYEAFVYTDEQGVVLLPGLEGWSAHRAYDVTNREGSMLIIVGDAQVSDTGGSQTGVVWEFDTTTGAVTVSEVAPLPGGTAINLTDINNNGMALGGSVQLTGRKPVVYDYVNNTLWQLDLPSIAADINDNNTVAGNEWRASLNIAPDGTITAGPVEQLGTMPNSLWSTISALNNYGTATARVVMTWSDGNGYRINGAARYDDLDPDGWKLLWASSRFDSANAINDHGDVVGSIGISAATRSALYIKALNAVYLLEDLIDPASQPVSFNSVADINDAGLIAVSSGAVLLVPQGSMSVPAAPGNLTAVPHLPTWQQPWNAITLEWQDNSDFTFDFTIERSISGANVWSAIRENWSPLSMWDMTVDLDVTYDYRVNARGLAGFSAYSNIATATAPSEPVDTENPVVTIIKPGDGENVSGRVKIRSEATDNIGVTYMDITIYSGYNTQRLCSGNSTALECTWNTRKLADGDYTIEAYASDTMGNGGYASVKVTIGDAGGGGESPTVVHVGDIDGTAVAGSRGRWKASVSVLVHDAPNNPVAGVTVSGSWSDGARGSGSCATDTAGRCDISTGFLKKNSSSATFTVNDVAGTNTEYSSGDNHDPDGDSTGTSIVVNK